MPLCPFCSLKALVPIHCYCMDKRDTGTMASFAFKISRQTGLKQHEVSKWWQNANFWTNHPFTRLRCALTCVQLSVRSSHHVAELLTAGTLAQASRPEAQFFHQHQRLLTKVVFPVPRHPPICIAHPPHTQPIVPQLSPPAPTGRRLSGEGVSVHFLTIPITQGLVLDCEGQGFDKELRRSLYDR